VVIRYLVKGKGNKTRYVYVSSAVISELKSNHWQPNKTNRFTFNNFLKKIKEKMNIPANVELTPHTLRRCFTTHNALNGVPMPILQKALGHANIRTTSYYWKGSVDIREFGEWLEPDASPKEPEEVPKIKVGNNPQLPKTPQLPLKLENPSQEPELSKTIEKLKRELAKRDLIITEKNKQLKSQDNEISLLTNEIQKLKAINQEKDIKLKELQEKLKELTEQNNLLIQNYSTLKNTAKKPTKNPVNNNQIEPEPPKEKNITKILLNSGENLPKNNLLTVKEKEAELVAQIQVWKPPN
jgi:Phage integrase family